MFFGSYEEKLVQEEQVVIEEEIVIEEVIEEVTIKEYEATFYTAFCPTGCIGITKSGYDVSNTIYYEGMRIIAAPKEIPLYTIFEVELEDGEQFNAIVLDRGGDIKGNRIDILVQDRNYAYQKGRQIAYMKEVK